MNGLAVVAKRELKSYFASPLAYVFVFIFTLLACGAALLPEFGLFGRSFGGLLEQDECNLVAFFETMPFLLAFFAPAIAMKLWAHERKTGTIELLFTYPLSTAQIVLGKFAAAWVVFLFALLMTAPLVIVIESIGTLSWLLLLGGYFATALLAAALTAIACAASAVTDNNVISLIIGVFICSILLLFNLIPLETTFLESFFRAAGLLEHFESLITGKISITAIGYFLSVTAAGLLLNLFFLDTK